MSPAFLHVLRASAGVAALAGVLAGPQTQAQLQSSTRHSSATLTASRHSPRLARRRPLVAVFGDSLITQAESQLGSSLKAARVYQFSYPGFAACSVLSAAGTYLETHRPKAVILEFWGDDSKETPCMTSTMESPGYYAQYEGDLIELTNESIAAGAHVFIVGTIPDAQEVAAGNPLWDHLNDIYSKIPGDFPGRVATFINVQAALELRGAFTWYLPCLSSETSCGVPVPGVLSPPPAGDNLVRSSEGLHFCPRFPQTGNFFYNFVRCDAYSSGSYRYATFIANAVGHYLKSNRAPSFVGPALPPVNSAPTGVSGQVDPYTGAVYPQLGS